MLERTKLFKTSTRNQRKAYVRTVRTAAVVATSGARVVRRGGHAVRGLACYFFAILWGFAGIGGGLATGDMPMIIGVGAMVAFMLWAGRRFR